MLQKSLLMTITNNITIIVMQCDLLIHLPFSLIASPSHLEQEFVMLIPLMGERIIFQIIDVDDPLCKMFLYYKKRITIRLIGTCSYLELLLIM